jgi:hypothetical protein
MEGRVAAAVFNMRQRHGAMSASSKHAKARTPVGICGFCGKVVLNGQQLINSEGIFHSHCYNEDCNAGVLGVGARMSSPKAPQRKGVGT